MHANSFFKNTVYYFYKSGLAWCKACKASIHGIVQHPVFYCIVYLGGHCGSLGTESVSL